MKTKEAKTREQPDIKPSVAIEADGLVHGDRNDSYGDPAVEFAKAAAMFGAILGVEVPVYKVPLLMIALKMVRQSHKPKRDNLVDICGYAVTADKLNP